jgi:hypothetical protein
MKRTLSIIGIIVLIFLAITCTKKEEQSTPRVPMKKGPIIDPTALPPEHKVGQKVELQVVVPEEVKDKWAAVKLLVEDKKLNKSQEFTVKLGDELKIPDSNLTVKVGDFLPDFKLGAQIITSASNNPVNPAVGVKIFENGTQIFPLKGKWGWLYAKHKTIHPFQHDRFRITLQEGIRKQ